MTLHSIPKMEILAHNKMGTRSFALGILRRLERIAVDWADTVISATSRLPEFVDEDFGKETQDSVDGLPKAVDMTSFDILRDMRRPVHTRTSRFTNSVAANEICQQRKDPDLPGVLTRIEYAGNYPPSLR